MENGFDYIWAWDRRGTPLEGRKGQVVRVWARGTMNSCGIEFHDGMRSYVSRNGLRRKPKDYQCPCLVCRSLVV